MLRYVSRINIIKETESKNASDKYKHRWIYTQSNYLQSIEQYILSMDSSFSQNYKEEIFEILYFFMKNQVQRCEKDGSFPFMSEVLYSISSNYKQIVELLELLQIISFTNRSYTPGRFSKVYGKPAKCRMLVLNNYDENLIINFPIHNKSRFKHYDVQRSTKSKHHLRFKTLTGLSIDEKEYERILSANDLKNCNIIKLEKLKHSLVKNGGMLTVEITGCDVNRIFYSTLSNLPKEIRRCILINGKKWIEWDASNSHPFIFHKLLVDRSFYLSDEVKKICGSRYHYFLNHTISKPELASFGKLVTTGTMYQFFMRSLKMTKEQVKECLRLTMYCAKYQSLFVELFKKKFPGIYELIRNVNGGFDQPLSHILLKVESLLIVENVIYEIEKIDGNVIGLHDACLLTDQSQKTLVKENLLKAFKKYNCDCYELPLFKDEEPTLEESLKQREVICIEIENIVSTVSVDVNEVHIFDELDQFRKQVYKRRKITMDNLMKRIPELKKMAKLIKDPYFMELIDQVVAMDKGEKPKEYIKIDEAFVVDYYSNKANLSFSPYEFWKRKYKNKSVCEGKQ
jgi:hypothetical protein